MKPCVWHDKLHPERSPAAKCFIGWSEAPRRGALPRSGDTARNIWQLDIYFFFLKVQKVGPRLRKIRKISKQNKRKKMKKSFLENIYSKLKEFARVTLASRRAAARNKTPRRGPASHNTGNSSHRPIILTEMTAGSPADGESSSEAPADDTGDGTESSSHSEPLNVMSFNEFSDGPELVPELVDTNDVSENNKAADIETSNTRYGMVPHTMGNQRQRSEEARGRSLWKVSRPAGGEVTEDHERPGASFASFTQEAAVLFDSKVGRDGGRGEGLMAWTNVIILGVSMVTVFALVSGKTCMKGLLPLVISSQ